MIAISTSVLFAWIWENPLVVWLGLFLSVLVITKHRENIKRLINGKESKIILNINKK